MMEKMIDIMMKRYQMFVWLGFILVVIAFGVAITTGANAQATFFSVDKATREAAGTGTSLALANAARHVVPTWVPALKFLGLGIMLGAITMALGMIIKTLRTLGQDVTDIWPAKLNPGVPEKPIAARLFPVIMMMGWMVLLVGLIWALALSPIVASYWNHSITTDLNPAQPGSTLQGLLGLIQSSLPWLGSLRFLGMALLFTAITVALTVIIRTLQFQEGVLENFVKARSGELSS